MSIYDPFAKDYGLGLPIPIGSPLQQMSQDTNPLLAETNAQLRDAKQKILQEKIDAIQQMSNRQLLEEIYKMLLERNIKSL